MLINLSYLSEIYMLSLRHFFTICLCFGSNSKNIDSDAPVVDIFEDLGILSLIRDLISC